jgi:hypothetical protein
MDAPTRPLQFGLRSLLLFITAGGVAFGFCKAFALGYGFAVFCLAFILFISLIVWLVTSVAARQVTVAETDSREEADLLCGLLREHGIPARIHDGELPAFGMSTQPNRIIVPAQQRDQACRVLERRTSGDA